MSVKKIKMGAKPANKFVMNPSPDQWVENRDNHSIKQETKRLTLDIPESLHRKIKTSCAARGTKIVHEITELLLKHYE